MIDYDLQPAVTRAVAKLKTPTKVGTGYLVRRDRIATCWHVVKDLAVGEAVTCKFGEVGEERTAYFLSRDQDSDSALLELRDPISADPLELVDASPRDFWVYGFPLFAGVSMSIEARLINGDTVDQNRIHTFSMYSDQFTGDAPLGGLSGSPVLVRNRVIGHMSSVLGTVDAPQVTHAGQAYAVRSAGVARLLGGNVPAAPARASEEATKAAVDHTVAITQVFKEIEASATIAEINKALNRGTEIVEAARLLAAERLIGLGAPGDALAVLEMAPDSARRTQLKALALSLKGEQATAVALLDSSSSESAGILGGAFKRRWIQTKDRKWLTSAHQAYAAAYALDHAPYPGVNLAACKLWLGDKDGSKQLAAEIATALMAEQVRGAWDQASLAEAWLLSGRLAEARTQYGVAVGAQVTQARSIAVMRRQVRLELSALGQPAGAFDELFPVPGIAVFTGHRVDGDESRGRFPPSRVGDVMRRLKATLEQRNILSGYSSAASGGDILFIEALLERGGEPHVFLPFPAADFVQTSVDDLWRERFQRIIDAVGARLVVLSSQRPDDTSAAYRACNEAMKIAAQQEGQLLDEAPVLIAVLSASETSAKTGGSAEMVARWQLEARGDTVRIDPNG